MGKSLEERRAEAKARRAQPAAATQPVKQTYSPPVQPAPVAQPVQPVAQVQPAPVAQPVLVPEPGKKYSLQERRAMSKARRAGLIAPQPVQPIASTQVAQAPQPYFPAKVKPVKKSRKWFWQREKPVLKDISGETLEQKVQSAKPKKKSKLKKAIATVALAGILAASAIGYGAHKLRQYNHESVDKPRVEYTRAGLKDLEYQNTIIRSRDGAILSSNVGNGGKHAVHSKRIKPNQLPEHFKDLLLSSEDSRFDEHYKGGGINTMDEFPYLDIYYNSIDITGMVRAAVNIVKTRQLQGGSTLSMQLAERIAETYRLEIDPDSCEPDLIFGAETLMPDKLKLKVCELRNAFTLQKALTPDEMVTEYANLMYVNGNVIGLNNALNYYFNNDGSDTPPTLSQLAFIVGAAKGPENYNAFKGEPEKRLKKLQAARDRTVTVLRDRYLPVQKKKLDSTAYADLENTVMKEIKNLDEGIEKNRKEIEEGKELESGFFNEGKVKFHAGHITKKAYKELELEKILEQVKVKLDGVGYSGEFNRERITEIYTNIDAEAQHFAEYLLQHQGTEWHMGMTRSLKQTKNTTYHTGNHIKEGGLYYAQVLKTEIDEETGKKRIITNLGIIDEKALARIKKHTKKDPADFNEKDIVYVSVRPGVKGKERLLDIEQDMLPFGSGIIAADPSTGGIEVLANLPSSTTKDINYTTDAKKQPGSLTKIFTHALSVKYGIDLDDTFNNVVLPQADLFKDPKWIVRNSHTDPVLKTGFKSFSDSDNALHVSMLRNIFLFSPDLYEKALEKHDLTQRAGESNREYKFRLFDGRDRKCAYNKELSMTGGCSNGEIYGIESDKGQMYLAGFEQAWRESFHSLIADGKNADPLKLYWHGIGYNSVKSITLAKHRSKKLDRYSETKKQRKIALLEEQLEADNLNRGYILQVHNNLVETIKELNEATKLADWTRIDSILLDSELYVKDGKINVNLQTRDMDQLLGRNPDYTSKFGEKMSHTYLQTISPDLIDNVLSLDNIKYNGKLPVKLVESIENRIENAGYNTTEWQENNQHLNPELMSAVAVREWKDFVNTLGGDLDDKKTDGLSVGIGSKEMTEENMLKSLQTMWNEGNQCVPLLIDGIKYDTGDDDLGKDGIVAIDIDPLCQPVYEPGQEAEYAAIAERIQELMRAPTFGTARRSGDHVKVGEIETETLYKTGTSQRSRDAWAAAITGDPVQENGLLTELNSSQAMIAIGAAGNYLINGREAGMQGHGSKVEGSDVVYMVHKLFQWKAKHDEYEKYIDPSVERLGFKKRNVSGDSVYMNKNGHEVGCAVVDEESLPGKSHCEGSKEPVYLNTRFGTDKARKSRDYLSGLGINNGLLMLDTINIEELFE